MKIVLKAEELRKIFEEYVDDNLSHSDVAITEIAACIEGEDCKTYLFESGTSIEIDVVLK